MANQFGDGVPDMPLSRDPRNDRRRRVLREASSPESSDQDARGKQATAARRSAEEDNPSARRSAGYSQEVRKACGQRLVQLIPVRPLSFLAVCLVSLVVPGTLMLFHYMIYVSGSLQWYGQPLAVALDASHPSSIAAWFGSHLWLLCLAATVLTFQLRRHKLDDYRGEYRLWFWLVLTCLLASVDSTTHLTELLGLAIDPWSRTRLGLSGPAFTTSTLAVMIGMLGLRLCSELKTVPMSLIFWLAGICAWAGSGALAQEELQLKMTLQFRIWLKSALWLGGLTAVWLAAISYLRAVYREAQQRFLSRTRMVNAKLARSDKDSQTSADGRRWKFGLPSVARREPQAEEQSSAAPRRTKDRASSTARVSSEKNSKAREQTPKDDAEAASMSGFGRFFQRRRETTPAGKDGGEKKQTPAGSYQQDEAEQSEGKPKKRFSKWLRPPKDDDEAREYQKVPSRKADRDSGKNVDATDENQPEDVKSASSGGWFKRKTQKQPAATKNSSTGKKWFSKGESASSTDGQSKPAAKKSGGLFAKFKLQPPDDSASKPDKTEQSGQKNGPQSKQQPAAKEAESQNDSNRPLTKAERRRMRRLQQKQNRAA